MDKGPTLDELRDLHKRTTYYVVQALLKGRAAPVGAWLYSKDGKPGTQPLESQDILAVFVQRDESPESAVIAMATLARSYLVAGGAMRSVLAARGVPLPLAIILVAPPDNAVEGEVVKTFVLTEHQTFLAESPVLDGGKSVRLGDLELLDVSLTHNQRPGKLN